MFHLKKLNLKKITDIDVVGIIFIILLVYEYFLYFCRKNNLSVK